MRSAATVLLLCHLCAACVQIEEYPPHWGDLGASKAAVDCALVGGVYSNAGETATGTRASLAAWIAPEAVPSSLRGPNARQLFSRELSDADAVELAVTPELLTVTLKGNSATRVWVYDRSKAEFSCTNGVIAINRRLSGGDNTIVVGSEVLHFHRLGDTLIVKSEGTGAGVMLVVPLALHASGWARFRTR